MHEGLRTAIAAFSPWEGLAVALAIGYLVLAMRENIWCWACALASTTIYTGLFWRVSLPMESLLNIYYMGMAVYGWQQWRGVGQSEGGVAITSWPWRRHLMIISAILAASALSGYWLDNYSNAAWPYVDSFTTWASVVVTWMVTKKILENWLYWIVIDFACVLMYFDRGLYLTSLLFAVYVVIVILGYFSWRALARQGLADERAIAAD